MTSLVSERRNSGGDYRVRFFLDGIHQADADYFTPSMVDAISTANFQCRRWNERKPLTPAGRKGGGA